MWAFWLAYGEIIYVIVLILTMVAFVGVHIYPWKQNYVFKYDKETGCLVTIPVGEVVQWEIDHDERVEDIAPEVEPSPKRIP